MSTASLFFAYLRPAVARENSCRVRGSPIEPQVAFPQFAVAADARHMAAFLQLRSRDAIGRQHFDERVPRACGSSEWKRHQRNSCGPSHAPMAAGMAIPSRYQTAQNGTPISGQWRQ